MRRALILGICFCLAWTFAFAQAKVETVRSPQVYTLGPEGDYESFTQAIEFLNGLISIPQSGITFLVSAGATFNENPPAIMRSATETAPVVFQKDGEGENPKILATGTTGRNDSVIRLEGVEYYTFDGIDVANSGNTTAMEYGFHLLNGAAYNTIKNCKITLNKANIYTRGVYSSSIGTGINHHNLYQNLEISNARYGMHILGSTAAPHIHETIENCRITNVSNYGILAPGGSHLVIRNNQIVAAERNLTLFEAIRYGGTESSAIVEANSIEASMIRNHFHGIYHIDGSAIIQHNNIGNLSITNNVPVKGIYIEKGDVTVRHNVLDGFSGKGTSLIGIEVNSNAGNTEVLGNQIANFECLQNHNSNAYAAGLILGGANCLAANNMIHDLNYCSNVQPSSIGIRTASGNIKLYYNSIRLQADAFQAGSSTACVYIPTDGVNVELVNNILANYSTAGAGGKTVNIWKESPGFTGLSSCSNNLFWLNGTGSRYLVAQIGSVGYQTLAEYQAASNLEQDSHFAEPAFAGDSSLHLDLVIDCLAKGNALPLAMVEVDFDGQIRDAVTPDIGADEALEIQEGAWEVLAADLDFGYVCSGAGPALRSLGIANLGMSTLVFDASCFTLVGSAGFELLTDELVIPPLDRADLQLGFSGVGAGERAANLIISNAGIVRNIPLSGILNTALEMPVKANWEADFEGWIPMDQAHNKWQISNEESFKGEAALLASTSGSGLIHLFADVVLPPDSPRVILNLLHQNVDNQDFCLWLVEPNFTPQAGYVPTGTQLTADLGAADSWNRIEYSIPASYAAQTVRLVLSFNALPTSKIRLDNLRVLGTPQQPASPLDFQIIKQGQAAKLTWQQQTDANEYLVEASELTTEGFMPLQATGNAELPVPLDAEKRFYRVRAFE